MKKQIHFWIEEDLKKELEEIAEEDDRSVSSFLRVLVTRECESLRRVRADKELVK